MTVRPIHYDNVGESENMAAIGYSRGATSYQFPLKIRADETLRNSLRNFYLTKTLGRSRQFTLTPDVGYDLGAGKELGGGEGAISTARIWDAYFEEEMISVERFMITLLIRHNG